MLHTIREKMKHDERKMITKPTTSLITLKKIEKTQDKDLFG